jgi:hypothetical protein
MTLRKFATALLDFGVSDPVMRSLAVTRAAGMQGFECRLKSGVE